jgi:hypothetical protein
MNGIVRWDRATLGAHRFRSKIVVWWAPLVGPRRARYGLR